MTPEPLPQQPAKKSKAPIFIVLGVVALGGCCMFSILAAIAIPNFIKFQARSKQTEAKANLRSIFSAQKQQQADTREYSTDATKLGIAAGTRYTCFLSPESVIAPTMASATAVSYAQLQLDADDAPGVRGTCPECQFIAVCAGNIDSDDTLDVWSVSSADRACGKAAAPCNDVNDLEQ